MSDTNDMRRDFEESAKTHDLDLAPDHQDGGFYQSSETDYAWIFWQAATERATAVKDAEIKALRQKVSENELMAECTVMLRDDLIEADIVDYFVPPMMLTEAILNYISAIRQAATERATASQWQDIATAPKDESVIILGYLPHHRIDRLVYEGRWHSDQLTWTSVNGFIVHNNATHWMPLPPPPAIRKGGAG